MLPTLYITRNGLLEPLGQSQVMAYLRGLSAEYRITLITFEKAEDLTDGAAMERAREDCARHGIRWLPQRFHRRPKGIAHAWSMILFFWLCLREVRRGNARLIHARSYIPAAVAFLVGRMTGTPFIFDMRALWPEEMITAGRLRRGSLIHRFIAEAERLCLRHAAAVVSLTEAAVVHLREIYPQEMGSQRVSVIPTCADLDRFVPGLSVPGAPRVYGCLGTVLSGWFRQDWLAAFFQAAAKRDPGAEFHIVTRDDAAKVRAAMGGDAAFQSRLQIYSMTPQEVHLAAQRQSVSVMFYAGGEASELGRSPTRMGEVLGCGNMVVANAGVGDVARIVEENRVGVLAQGSSPEQMNKTLGALEALMSDPDLRSRCRRTAEAVFSLEAGTKAYKQLYSEILRSSTTRKMQ
jgi:glycosyltransferase involved in cell wall biosynthesis